MILETGECKCKDLDFSPSHILALETLCKLHQPLFPNLQDEDSIEPTVQGCS